MAGTSIRHSLVKNDLLFPGCGAVNAVSLPQEAQACGGGMKHAALCRFHLYCSHLVNLSSSEGATGAETPPSPDLGSRGEARLVREAPDRRGREGAKQDNRTIRSGRLIFPMSPGRSRARRPCDKVGGVPLRLGKICRSALDLFMSDSERKYCTHH